MSLRIITNNKMVFDRFKDSYTVELYDMTYREILLKVRDYVHEGYKLLSHPLSGSIKPNETPYKSVIISNEKDKLDFDSLNVIEGSIVTCEKFGMNRFHLTEEICNDFMIVDLSLISGALSESTKV